MLGNKSDSRKGGICQKYFCLNELVVSRRTQCVQYGYGIATICRLSVVYTHLNNNGSNEALAKET